MLKFSLKFHYDAGFNIAMDFGDEIILYNKYNNVVLI